MVGMSNITSSLYNLVCKIMQYNPNEIETLVETIRTHGALRLSAPILKINNYLSSISKNISIDTLGWKEYLTNETNKEMKNIIGEFRSSLDDFIKRTACEKNVINEVNQDCHTTCISSGNNDITSDIDITIKGPCLDKNVNRLIALRRYFQNHLFKNSPWNGNLQTVFRFFDMNFYLSDFAILKNQSLDPNSIDSYYLTTDFQTQLNYIHRNKIEKRNTTNNEEPYFQAANRANCVFDELKNSQHSNDTHKQNLTNTFINEISNIALYEDECYVSQGAFMHVVYMLQQKKPFYLLLNNDDKLKTIFYQFMICSILENLQFAISHTGKSRGKYIYRVLDAYYNINTYTFEDNFLNKALQSLSIVQYEQEYYNVVNIHINRYNGVDVKNDENKLRDSLQHVYTENIKNVYNNILNHYLTSQNGGRNSYKKLIDKHNNVVKKQINGRLYVVYIDKQRRQYIKKKNTYISLNDARKMK